MSNIIYEYLNENGEVIHVQVEDQTQRETTRGGSADKAPVLKRVQMKFEEALGTVKAATNGLKNVIDQVEPDEASVEFSIKAEGEAGLFTVCRAATSAEFKITLTWKYGKSQQKPTT